MPLIKSGSKEAVSKNISEMRKSGHPLRQAIAASLSNQRKYKKMAEGGEVLDQELMQDLPEEHDGYPTMEPDMTGPNKVESMGQSESDARDVVDQGTASKPSIPSDVDKGSPQHSMNEADTGLSEELMEFIRKHKNRFKQE